MNIRGQAEKSFLWGVIGDGGQADEAPIDDFSRRVLEGVGTSRDGRNDSICSQAAQSEVGTLGTVGTALETLDNSCSEFRQNGRNSRNSPVDQLTFWLARQRLRVPPEWCSGVARLHARHQPWGIDLHRWVRFRYDALRLLCEQGPELHALGWDSRDLFGLLDLFGLSHAEISGQRLDCQGVAWLIAGRRVTSASAQAVTLADDTDLTTQAFRLSAQARKKMVEAWRLT